MDKIIAIQANSLESLKLDFDTSLLIAAELNNRNYQVFFYEPDNLVLTHNCCLAKGRFVKVRYHNFINNFEIINEATINLADCIAVLIRQDPPFDMSYITNTYILETISHKVKILNDPAAIRSNSEKMAIFKFADFIPPTIVASSFNQTVADFIVEHKKVVLKSLYWFGGKHAEVLTYDDSQIPQKIAKFITEHQQVMIQKFLPAIEQGDKRIFVINGEVVAAMLRTPKAGEFLANAAVGGTLSKTELTARELMIASEVAKYLKSEGILLAGLDMLDEYLTEINVTSPTGLIAIDRLYGINLVKKYVDNANLG